MTFQILTAVSIQVVVLWDVTPSCTADLSHCLSGISCPQDVCLCSSLMVLI
jgi:MoaA/NifB/PqqE/SkfB family radical SAM enzyme